MYTVHCTISVKNTIRNAKTDFEKKLANEGKRNPRSFCNYINSNKSSHEKIGSLKVGESIIDNDHSIAVELNKFFTSVFTRENINNFDNLRMLDEDVPVVISEILFTFSKVSTVIKKMKKYSACGPVGFLPRLLMECESELCTPLCILFNKSFITGEIPSDWKCANVVLIFKKGSKFKASNYRPISLTSMIGRTMESIIKTEKVRHLNENNGIYSIKNEF